MTDFIPGKGEKVYNPRISFEVPQDLQTRLQTIIPWGLQSHIFRVMTEGLLLLLEGNSKERDVIIAAFLSKDISVFDLLKKSAERSVKGESI